jgi:hypothetical protein
MFTPLSPYFHLAKFTCTMDSSEEMMKREWVGYLIHAKVLPGHFVSLREIRDGNLFVKMYPVAVSGLENSTDWQLIIAGR